MVRVDVSTEVLTWAAYRSGKVDTIKQEFPGWSKWLSKEGQPTFKQLESLAKATSTPLGYFFLPKPPIEQLPVPHYRTIDDHTTNTPSPNLLETLQTMQRRQDWMLPNVCQAHNIPCINTFDMMRKLNVRLG